MLNELNSTIVFFKQMRNPKVNNKYRGPKFMALFQLSLVFKIQFQKIKTNFKSLKTLYESHNMTTDYYLAMLDRQFAHSKRAQN